jgi:hypothetical protein
MTKDWIKTVEKTIAGNPNTNELKDILTIALRNYKKNPKLMRKKTRRKKRKKSRKHKKTKNVYGRSKNKKHK